MAEVRTEHGAATRRGVLLGAGALGAGAIITACAGKEESSTASSTTPTSATPGGETATSPAGAQVKASEVPVDGGTVFKELDTVVTQPQAGEFKAFSATCTHKQCTVGGVANGTIDCPCHGSKFSMTDGTVVNPPATEPLPAKTVTVDGDMLTIG